MTAGLSCASVIDAQLAAWDATEEVLAAPGGPAGGPVYRIATSEIGVWITLHQPSGLERTSLFRTTPAGTVRRDYGASCRPETSEVPGPERRGDEFTDRDLKTLLEEDDRLIIYLWSPHLPLSVEGYAEIVAASRALGVRLVAVVDGGADRSYVERVSDEHDIPVEARRSLGSVELLFRDLAVHTPTTLVFASGLVSAPLPGYRDRHAYERQLAPMLARRER